MIDRFPLTRWIHLPASRVATAVAALLPALYGSLPHARSLLAFFVTRTWFAAPVLICDVATTLITYTRSGLLRTRAPVCRCRALAGRAVTHWVGRLVVTPCRLPLHLVDADYPQLVCLVVTYGYTFQAIVGPWPR